MMFNNQDLRRNFLSGFLVSFIALPLCIAISLASGFPALAGIFTAIIGGMIVSQIGGSHVAINGPAAGMIVVILGSVETLGEGDALLGYKYTLAAIVFAAILQIIISFTELPKILRKFPESIIRGMMIAIGLIVIVKQSFVIFGYTPPKAGLMPLFTKLPQAFLGMQKETFLIGVLAILFIIFWKKIIDHKNAPKFFSEKISKIPVHLIVIILGAIIANVFKIDEHRHYLNAALASPMKTEFISLSASLVDSISFPDFGKVVSYQFFLAVFSIFAVGSLETILSAIAVDKIDYWQRKTDLKKDLRAIGIGNLICGMIGALPMIAEIVRSTANVRYGANNKWSNFFHGLFLLLMITIFGKILHFIPLCILAGMLILVGWNLINIKLVFKVFRRHKYNFIIIFSVVFFTLYIDLLVGVGCGMLVWLVIEKFLRKKQR